MKALYQYAKIAQSLQHNMRPYCVCTQKFECN